ncbi:hypothetical protein AMEX_G23230 [Astyanax mexicanus]|uniref:CxC7-like cysteine cluster associated with KDZ transposases domain-containing protein n=1 Tax=Astyanax mexicanus TaxID=7994 RepID=A0A8T2KZZ0_ASTMX|nr:hypothetical protein AMEX_G23230 [Astyanax mexicanus]
MIFLQLVLESEVEGAILNCCLKLIEQVGEWQVYLIWEGPQLLSHSSMELVRPGREEYKLCGSVPPCLPPFVCEVCVLDLKPYFSYFSSSFVQTQWNTFLNLAEAISSGPWTEEIPMQHSSNSCGVFMLMYALYMVLGGIFDFTETDMPAIRRWWCALLLVTCLECTSGRAKKMMDTHGLKPKKPTTCILEVYIVKLNIAVGNVVYEDGDAAFLHLSLVCRDFYSIVNKQSFRRKAHLAWLDSTVNWDSITDEVRRECRAEYKLSDCSECKQLYKDIVGYCGRGKEGAYQGFYADQDFPGFCSADCANNWCRRAC